MRLRVVTTPVITAAIAVVAALLLAGCGGSNVGVAAKFDGKQVTETQLENFVTPKAKGVQLTQNSSALTPPKSFALFILIRERLYADLLRDSTGGPASPGQIAALVNSYVRSGSPQQAVAALGVKGYSASFANEVLRYRALGSLLDQRVRSHVDVNGALKKLAFPVSINPRYGQWDRKTLSIETGRTAGLPGFVTLRPGSALSALSG